MPNLWEQTEEFVDIPKDPDRHYCKTVKKGSGGSRNVEDFIKQGYRIDAESETGNAVLVSIENEKFNKYREEVARKANLSGRHVQLQGATSGVADAMKEEPIRISDGPREGDDAVEEYVKQITGQSDK